MNYSIRWLFSSTYYLRIAVHLSCSEFYLDAKFSQWYQSTWLFAVLPWPLTFSTKIPRGGRLGCLRYTALIWPPVCFLTKLLFDLWQSINQTKSFTLGTFLFFIWFNLKEREIDNVWFARKRNVIWKKDK